MKILFFVNLFMICCNSFILQPKSLLLSNNKFNSITPISISKPIIKNTNLYLKKNKEDDDKEPYKEEIIKLSIYIIYNTILYSCIYSYIFNKH